MNDLKLVYYLNFTNLEGLLALSISLDFFIMLKWFKRLYSCKHFQHIFSLVIKSCTKGYIDLDHDARLCKGVSVCVCVCACKGVYKGSWVFRRDALSTTNIIEISIANRILNTKNYMKILQIGGKNHHKRERCPLCNNSVHQNIYIVFQH